MIGPPEGLVLTGIGPEATLTVKGKSKSMV